MSAHTHQDPFDEGFLKVSDLHTIYYAQYGNKTGKPALFLHGGPGGGTTKSNTTFFNPHIYRVILLDQRGAGKSTPVAETRENTTQLLVQDIETLRHHLAIEKWHLVFGGSWGSTLSLAYTQTHPSAVQTLILRGIFLGVEWEFDWTLRGQGTATMFPAEWEEFIGFLPENQRADPVTAYHEILHSGDTAKALEAATAWNKWELSISFLVPAEDVYAKLGDEDWNLQHARIETHYFVNGCFLRHGKELLKPENVAKLAGIPTYIVQGRYDLCCPPKAAWLLHQALPKSELYWSVPAGHSALEPETFKKLTELCDMVAER